MNNLKLTRRSLLKAGALTGIGVALAACSSAPTAPDKIKIGAVIPLTGRFAAGGEQVKAGYELVVEAINKAGGAEFQGKKIPLELIILDDESDPAKTVQKFEQLNSSNQVHVYFGGFGSDLHSAAAAIAEKNKIPYMGVAFALKSIHEKGFKYLFSPFPKSPQIAATSIEMLAALPNKPAKVIGFIEKSDWGVEMDKAWAVEAQKRGIQYVKEEYAPGAKDFAPMILKAKEVAADVVVGIPSPPDGIAITKQMKELDFNPKASFMIRSSDNLSWITALGKDGDFTLTMPGWATDVKFPGTAELSAAHQAKYGKPAAAVTGPAYAMGQILVDAVKRAKTLDRDGLRDAIAATNMTTVTGPVKFAADGVGEVPTVVIQYQNGKQVSVWPEKDAAAKVSYPATPWKQR